eukprot:GHUV01004984.1.p1 GENE.GHUV01004984.1~~GHUV01004984.1.p1  ORF type:complete len:457 (+),score=118.12 GHUV01004984.1:151-1521(+)
MSRPAMPAVGPFLNLEELEEMAKSKLTKMAYDYYAGGANTQQSVRDNRTSFANYRILPRILVDVSRVDTSCNMFGYKMSAPIIVAPMAMHGLAHCSKELGTACGAAAAGIPMTVSTMANMGLEEIAVQANHPCLLFQLYVIKDRQLVAHWVQQAEAAGYKALVVTVDAQRLGTREADERNRFRLPDHLQMANLQPLADKRARDLPGQVVHARDVSHGSGLFSLFAKEVDDSLTWEAIPWLRTLTSLPIYIKGVLSPEDARLAVQYGVDGIIISNHGGRQLDYSPSALDMLPDVVAAVGGQVPILMDGGIRRGTDVLKALALGAKAVLLGRPVLYGLAVNGQEGVTQVLETLRRELELAMALSGCRTLQDMGPQLLLQFPTAGLKPVAAGYGTERSGSSCNSVSCGCSSVVHSGSRSGSSASSSISGQQAHALAMSAGDNGRCEQTLCASSLQRSKL